MLDPYWRRCKVNRVVDGDTIDLMIDLGYHVFTEQRMRLLGIDCPETRGDTRALGLAASYYTQQWLLGHLHNSSNWPFRVRSEKADSFGRFLAFVECENGHSLCNDLVASGNAREV